MNDHDKRVVEQEADVADTNRDKVANEAIGEVVARLTNDQTLLLRKQAKRSRVIIVTGLIWSFIYTCISLLIMLGMTNEAEEVCEQFAAGRENVRTLVLNDPDFDNLSFEEISAVFPPIEC